MNASIKTIEIQASAARCEVVTLVTHDNEEAKDSNDAPVILNSRRFPVRAMAPYATARAMADVARAECPTALVSVRFC